MWKKKRHKTDDTLIISAPARFYPSCVHSKKIVVTFLPILSLVIFHSFTHQIVLFLMSTLALGIGEPKRNKRASPLFLREHILTGVVWLLSLV